MKVLLYLGFVSYQPVPRGALSETSQAWRLCFSLRVSLESPMICCKTFDLSQSSTSFSVASVRRPCFPVTLSPHTYRQIYRASASFPHTNNEAGVFPSLTQGALKCLWRMPVLWAHPLLGTVANLSSDEHRVAIFTAANNLHHLPLHSLSPIFCSTSSKCPCSGISFVSVHSNVLR